MNNLKELSFEEMQEVDGGGWMIIAGIFAVAILTDMAMNPGETIEVFKRGYEKGAEDGKN
ncbi:class IIb bacteriocin, lactobin A/cerein 7B family [Belliella sp. DSM 107340]|uniref:Class IIb bacteriocin, lactobin A/cerein 7B family n=1 Tax=Belliella calami TaxID=2923436 RepID=A0ABS9UR85_9BACT|nr:class IIb bacteriocin, lactobin A/cerein 7B family [Belliella calami]MCH7399028.1 class IIb bacteriocin, lactobin A/cerein 7B family [Belliella calami]